MPQEDYIIGLHGKSTGFGALNEHLKKTSVNMEYLAIRAAAVIPIWAALRTVTLALPRAIGAATREWSSFQTEMSRVATVTRGSAEAIGVLEDNIKSFAATSKASFKDTASAVYALGSAGLDVKQQFSGLEHVMNVAIGTGADVEMTSKLMAGAVNVFGDSLADATTKAAQFKKIGDTIAYTYSTQQIELSELATALGYVASVGSLVDIKFEELVATIGVLNTGMLKGSKSGTSLVNAFIQLANKSGKLAELQIDIDTSKPLDFLEVMTKLHEKFGDNKLSLENLSKLMSVFGIRGGRAVGLLIANFDFFQKTLAKTMDGKTVEDFAEVMRRIAEDNVPALAQKIKNSFTGVWMDILDQWETPFKSFLQRIQGSLDDFRASENAKKFFDKTTTAEATARAIPNAAVGASTLFAVSRMPTFFKDTLKNSKVTGELVKERADTLMKDKAAKLAKPQDAKGRFRKVTDADRQQLTKLRSSQFYGEARKGLKSELDGTTTAFQKLRTGISTTARAAIVAYGSIKLIQAGMNQFAPDSQATRDLNDGMAMIESAVMGTINKLLLMAGGYYRAIGVASVTLTELIGGVVADVWGSMKEVFNVVVDSITDFVMRFKDPLLTLAAILSGANVGGNLVKLVGQINEVNKKSKEAVEGDTTGGAGEILPQKNNLFNKIQNRWDRYIDNSIEALDKAETSNIQSKFTEAEQIEAFKELQPVLDKLKLSTSAGASQKSLLEEFRTQIVADRNAKNPDIVKLQESADKIAAVDTKFETADLSNPQVLQNYSNELADAIIGLQKGIEEYTKKGPLEGAAKEFVEFLNLPSIKELETKEGREGYAVLAQTYRQTASAEIAKSFEQTQALFESFKTDLTAIYDQADVNTLKLFDFSADKIAFLELQNAVKKFNADNETAQFTVGDLMVQNSAKVLEYARAHKDIQNDILALEKKATAVIEARNKEIRETGAFVRDAYKDIFTDMFDGEDFDTIGDNFANSIASAFKSNASTLLGDALADITGADVGLGGMFKGLFDAQKDLTSPIAKAHLDAITRGADIIEQAHINGMTKGAMGGSKTYGKEGGIGGAIKDALMSPIFGAAGANLSVADSVKMVKSTKNIKNLLDGKPEEDNDPIFDILAMPTSDFGLPVDDKFAADVSNIGGGILSTPTATRGGMIGGLLSQFTGENNASWGGLLRTTATWGTGAIGIANATGGSLGSGLANMSMLSNFGTVGSNVLAGYKTGGWSGAAGGLKSEGSGIGGAVGAVGGVMNAIQGFQSGNNYQGVGGILQGVGSIVSMIPVYGQAIGGVIQLAGSILSLFGKKTESETQTKTDTFKVASKIDITNQRLDIINRNLVALKDTVGYILPESAYFSESVNISDQFSLHARRGLA